MRTLVALLVLALAPWAWPVEPHEVVRAFDAPETPYGRGHRGIDIEAPTGSVVRAPQGGVVRFAGPVAGRPVISIEHAGGLVSSFEPVEPAVAAGDIVVRGQRIGVLQPGHASGSTRLHLGARSRGRYVDPLPLLGVERPVLLPMSRVKRGARAIEHARRSQRCDAGARAPGGPNRTAAAAAGSGVRDQARGCAVR